MATTLTVNGRPHAVAAPDDTMLLHVLRNELNLNGPKFGCGLGQCGACTVLISGHTVRACTMPVFAVRSPVTTIEGLAGSDGKPHPVQAAFIAEQAAQCGYCTNGMVMATVAFLHGRREHGHQHQEAGEADIRAALDGNLCRCGAHMRILRAVRRAAGLSGSEA
jgi:nicotinate dehydrogenase subunit A